MPNTILNNPDVRPPALNKNTAGKVNESPPFSSKISTVHNSKEQLSPGDRNKSFTGSIAKKWNAIRHQPHLLTTHVNTASCGAVVGAGSISTVYDLGNGYVEKKYTGRIDGEPGSRLTAANNNVKGFNRYYGENSATVCVTPAEDGAALVSAKLKKIEGCALDNLLLFPNDASLEEMSSIIERNNPSQKLANTLSEKGIIHYDINKGNVIYNKGEFYIVDFDRADILQAGKAASVSQNEYMEMKFRYVFSDVLRDVHGKLNT